MWWMSLLSGAKKSAALFRQDLRNKSPPPKNKYINKISLRDTLKGLWTRLSRCTWKCSLIPTGVHQAALHMSYQSVNAALI